MIFLTSHAQFPYLRFQYFPFLFLCYSLRLCRRYFPAGNNSTIFLFVRSPRRFSVDSANFCLPKKKKTKLLLLAPFVRSFSSHVKQSGQWRKCRNQSHAPAAETKETTNGRALACIGRPRLSTVTLLSRLESHLHHARVNVLLS